MIAKISVMFVRFALCLWVGAAVLFVITGVLEATTGNRHMTSGVLDVLVTVRFPPYYMMGWTCLGVTLFFGTIALISSTFFRKRLMVILLLSAIALITMVVDYQTIYTPLEKMVTPPGTKPRTMEFTEYHEHSKHINMFDVSLCLIAALLACYPIKEKQMQSKTTSSE